MKNALTILAILAFTMCSAPNKKNADTVTLVTYNVGVFSKSGTNTSDMVAAMMKELSPDAISLNELDSCTQRNPYFQIKDFAKKMGGWYFLYAPAIKHQGGKYGIGIVNSPKLTALKRYSISLDKMDGGEQRALAVVEFQDFVFCSTHLDHRSSTAQLRQVAQIDSLVAADFGLSGKPVILCGDLNCLPDSGTIAELEKNWTVISPDAFTFSAKNPSKRIDYFLVRKSTADRIEVKDARVCRTFKSGDVAVASDHLPVLVTIKIK